jgi:hypothetical protein
MSTRIAIDKRQERPVSLASASSLREKGGNPLALLQTFFQIILITC